MRREELAPLLRQHYSPERGCGVAHIKNPGYENIWFVVPPDPPRDLPSKLPVARLKKAVAVLQKRPHWNEASEIDQLLASLFTHREGHIQG